ncbi:MAG: hypothetical protein P8X42_08995, partial [Calditrichaceae bacterium]
MYKLIGLYLLIVIGIFIQFNFLGSIGNIILKIMITAGISYLMYDYWISRQNNKEADVREQEPGQQYENKSSAPEEKKSLFFDITSTRLTGLIEQDEKYLDFLKHQFMLVWDFVYPKNGFIIYKNSANKFQLIHKNLQPDILLRTDKYPTSLFTLVESKDGILIENKIEPALNLIPFYQDTDYNPQSLLAFMLALDSGEKLYWIFDSDIPENFNTEDISTIKNIIQTADFFTFEALKSYGLNNTCEYLNGNLQLAENLNKAVTMDECLELFCDFIVNEFEAAKLTVGMRDNFSSQTAVVKKSIGLDDPFKSGYAFPLEEGLNGFVIMKNKPHLIDDIEKGEYFVPRFSKKEKTNYGIRSFLSVPIE